MIYFRFLLKKNIFSRILNMVSLSNCLIQFEKTWMCSILFGNFANFSDDEKSFGSSLS